MTSLLPVDGVDGQATGQEPCPAFRSPSSTGKVLSRKVFTARPLDATRATRILPPLGSVPCLALSINLGGTKEQV